VKEGLGSLTRRWRVVVLVVLVALALFLAPHVRVSAIERHMDLVAEVAQSRAWAAPVYALAYAVVITLSLPATVCTILGGMIFGTVRGGFLSWSGAMLGTAAAYTLARTLAHGTIRRAFGKHAMLDRLREDASLVTLIRLRVVPLAPFGVFVFVAALAGVPLRRLVLATAIGILPSVVVYSYVGRELMNGFLHGADAGTRPFWIAGIVTAATVIATVVLPAIWRRRHRH
jgi:uncharacterized membrane protein YdjX (TVP38/TMEM64 family)